MSRRSAARPGRERRHEPSGDPTAACRSDPTTRYVSGPDTAARQAFIGLASLTAWRRTAARLGAALAVLVLAAVTALDVAHSL